MKDLPVFSVKIRHLFALLLTAILSGCATAPAVFNTPATLKSPRFGHALVSDNNYLYVLGGSNKNGWLSSVEIIDPKSGEHRILENTLIPRRYFSAVWDGDHSIYIIGGISCEMRRCRYEKRVEVFDTQTGEVSQTTELRAPTRNNTAVYQNGKIYVMGGDVPPRKKGERKATALTLSFDLATKKWTRLHYMPTAKATRAFAKDGYLYVVGGYDHKSALDTFERYDPKNNSWTSLELLPEKLSAHSVALWQDKLYAFGDYRELTSTYRYDFKTHHWQKLDAGFKASRHNAAITLNNKIYVVGGTAGSRGPFLDNIQVFDPRTEHFQSTE